MWNLTYATNALIHKTETGSETENKPVATKGEGEGK